MIKSTIDFADNMHKFLRKKKIEITTDLSCFIAIVELSILFFSGIGCDDYSFFDKNIFFSPRFAIKKK